MSGLPENRTSPHTTAHHKFMGITVPQVCGPLQVMCGLGRPIQSDVRSSQGDVRYSYAHKFVMCGDVWFSGRPYMRESLVDMR